MTENILTDSKFKKIQRLNSPQNPNRRSSITQDTGSYKNFDLDATTVSEDTNTSVTELEPPLKYSSDIKHSKSQQELFEKHVMEIKQRYKLRYRAINTANQTKDVISYFEDVNFELRPSILDGAVNEPFQLHFEGPTMERQIRTKERAKIKKLKRKYTNSTPLNSSPSSSDVEQEEIIDTKVTASFSGLYVVLWMMIGFGVLKTIVDYYGQTNRSLKEWAIVEIMLTDLIVIAAADLVMYLAIYFGFIIHWLCKNNVLSWNRSGWKLVSLYEVAYLCFFIYLPEHVLNLHWIGKIFLFLHSLVLLMKLHSFSFYNGYLWSIHEELQYSKNALQKLKDSHDEASEQKDEIIETLTKSIDFCNFEINSQSILEKFPQNINIKNFFMFTMFPTVVYQIEYPRTKKIRWDYVVEKIVAIFGTIFIMVVNAQVFMYPVAIRCLAVRNSPWTSVLDRFSKWVGLMIDIVPSFIVMYLLVFYLIWDAILNCIAELTLFGDRYFYGDWWNCVTWAEFSRIWNVPVHKFLLRHVYHSSISSMKLSKSQATFMTFCISSVVHELAMYVIFKRLRFYLFFFQMLQLPLVSLTNTKFLKKKTVFGNVVFWLGICTGPSVMCTLYLTI
ncbi:hypothetical protein KAFR_0F00800 [Kazachstania africana CBS 2517]|uniref:O-acyltransferase n=1 Tax=Kazachstania africana (strain ATCC 22294 / BCRC 22015 / CBS 2517 / CECT 1963 / NBRC 1671 / NRRL Y-8276) TaxID=1071382 RepID=H2AWC7_KAZAF|nr:hypothetical protein KAFR_0F00800 [Kazachstania africana CBS 2517]CCF58677.1 hypothetical protein KAFR_0F00800 [Kazachstania africana CBS 2517]